MKTMHLIAAAFAAMLTNASMAQGSAPTRAELLRELDQVGQQRAATYAKKSTQTRAEVLADTAVWRRSGMAELSRGEAGPDIFSDRYQNAKARYQAMKESPQYPKLLQSFADERGETVLAAAKGTAALR